MLSHVTFGTQDVRRAKAFYEATLAPLGFSLQTDGRGYFALSTAADRYPWVYVMKPFDRRPASWGNGAHLALLAEDDAAVERFHETALANGGSDEGAPGLREQYSADYYAAYVRDPDGNKLQAVHYRNGRSEAANSSGLSHFTVGSNDLVRSRDFYAAVLRPLGLVPTEEDDEDAVAYGVEGAELPVFYAHLPFDGLPATWGNGTHAAFLAPNRAAVISFHAAALNAGGSDEGGPGPRPHYSPTYYAAYVRDPDGNKLQAVCYVGD